MHPFRGESRESISTNVQNAKEQKVLSCSETYATVQNGTEPIALMSHSNYKVRVSSTL